MRGCGSLFLAFVLLTTSAYAQQAQPSPFAIDTVAASDGTVDTNGNFTTGVTLDAVITAGLGRGFEAIVRPFVQRLASGEWNRQIWIATLRYQRPGDVGLRVDAGLIPSPIGAANLMLRPHLNPTIALPSSLFTALPPVELPGPRMNLLGAVYSAGVSATVSGEHWDARAAVIDTSPMRTRRVFARANPPRFATAVFGAGITPFVGLRVGASMAHGGVQKAGESPSVTEDRQATMFTVETDFSVRYTRIVGEWVRDAFETRIGDQVASGWFLQGHQVLTPRWFAAGRVERMSAPLLGVERQHLVGVEETLGFRLTPEVTIRGSHRARRSFGRSGFDNTAAVSIVWWQRWL